MKKKFSNVQQAIEDFDKKFYDKTVKGDYVEVELNYDDENEAGINSNLLSLIFFI